MAKQQRTIEADAPLGRPDTCAASGEVTARRMSPDDFSIWLYIVELGAGAALEWGTDHGDEAVFVIDGGLAVTGNSVEADECVAGGAVLLESGVAARVEAKGPTKIAHFGSADPGAPQSGPRGVTVHVIGPRGRYESPPDRPFFRFFADSTCPTCDTFLLFSQRDHGWSVTPHSHSADELIYVLSGGVRTGSQVNNAGTCLAFAANVKYALAAEESGFESVNFRARRSELKFVDGEGSMEETAANVGGVEVAK
jgi:uncharacterized cupin superfamily protein